MATRTRLLDRVAIGWIELEHTSLIFMGHSSEFASVGLSTLTTSVLRVPTYAGHCSVGVSASARYYVMLCYPNVYGNRVPEKGSN